MGAVAHTHEDRPHFQTACTHFQNVAHARGRISMGKDQHIGGTGHPRVREDPLAQLRIKRSIDVHLAFVEEVTGLCVQEVNCRAQPFAGVARNIAKLRLRTQGPP